jgi:hypothetical protein
MSFLLYARGDNSTANNASVNSQNTNTVPTTEIVFDVDPAAGEDGDFILEYNDGASDPDTLMYVDGVATTFTVEFSGLLPTTNNLSNVNGFDLRGEEIVVVTDDTTGQRYYMLTNSETLFSSDEEMFATLDAIPNGSLAITTIDTATPITICFARGSRIDTPSGPCAIEKLQIGDHVLTDTGPEPILWIGSRVLSAIDLIKSPSLRPIIVRKNALSPGYPSSDVILSPNHRLLLNDWRLELHFGLETALCAAKHLVDGKAVQSFMPTQGIEYFHIMLASHRTVTCEGLISETLYTGQNSLAAVSEESRAELLALFPDMFTENRPPLVRPELGRYEASLVA